MSIQLTPEQERRIRAIVDAGAYGSAEQALDASIAVIETIAVPGVEGSAELESLLLEGLASGELSEKQFWESVDRETNDMLAQHKRGQRS